MALDPKAVGKKTPELVHEVGWKETALYALGCGAKLRELDFLYEKRGPKVLPTYAVVPAFPACTALMTAVGGDVTGIVHGAQKITLHRPFAPEGRLVTVGRVAGIYDMKKLATCIIATETRDGAGALVAETEWQIIFRFDGNFGGERPPKTERVSTPEREPDFRVEEATAPEQALLYRLSGDLNPLHADPEMAESVGFGRPILHGLCTYGYVGRAVLHQACGSDPARLKSLSGQFRRPVWPGDTLVVEGWKEGSRVVLRALCRERPDEPVFGNAWADVG
jgi:acyl dehydratase